MTGLEMQIEFERMLQLSNPNLEYSERPDTETIYAFLNKAVLKILNEIYLPAIDTTTNIEKSASAIQDLGLLVVREKSISLTDKLLPKDMFHIISVVVKVDRDYVYPMVNAVIDTKLVGINTLNKYRDNMFNTPILRRPIACVFKDKVSRNMFIDILVDRFTILKNLYITYIKIPDKISDTVNCELSVHLHNRVVELARDLFNSEKYKLSSSNNNKQDKKDE